MVGTAGIGVKRVGQEELCLVFIHSMQIHRTFTSMLPMAWRVRTGHLAILRLRDRLG